jgi:hypothetical protein
MLWAIGAWIRSLAGFFSVFKDDEGFSDGIKLDGVEAGACRRSIRKMQL